MKFKEINSMFRLAVPQPKCFVQLNPLRVNFDGLTILWLHTFIRGLEKTLTSRTPSTVAASDSTSQSSSVPVPQLEVRLEALMPRVINFVIKMFVLYVNETLRHRS
jgi:hypothetical protein